MSEEQETTSETTTEDSNDRDKSAEPSKATQLRKENEELATEITEKKRLINEEEKLNHTESMSGKAEAGVKAEKKEETPAEYTEKVMSGNSDE